MDSISLSEGIAQSQSDVLHLQPTDVEEELQQGEHRQVEVQIMTGVTLNWIQELTTDQTSQEKTVDRYCRHLIQKHSSGLAATENCFLSIKFLILIKPS